MYAHRPWTRTILPAGNCLLERRNVAALRRVFERHQQQMAGVLFGFIRERVARDDRLPLFVGADEDICGKPQLFRSSVLDQALQFRSGPSIASEDHVAALQKRLHVDALPRLASSSRRSDIPILLCAPRFTARSKPIYVVMEFLAAVYCSASPGSRGGGSRARRAITVLASRLQCRVFKRASGRKTLTIAGINGCTAGAVADRPRVIVSLPNAAEATAVADWLLVDGFNP